ncbi:restriction endonuclease [Lysobacter sp. 2RAF19]
MSLKRVSQRRDDALARTDWAEVERLLAKHYGYAGYEVDHCGTGSGGARYDGGIDLKLRRNGEYVIVQCKHWNAMKVPHNDVHQLIGVMVNEGATGAILVTSGEFTRAAVEAATKQGHVQLVDGDDLRAMLGPLPEPLPAPPSGFTDSMTSKLGPNAKGAAAYIGGRLLSAAEDRIRGGGTKSVASRSVGFTAKAFILKVLFLVLVPFLIVLLFMTWMKHVFVPDYLMPMAPAAADRIQQQRRAVQPQPMVVEQVETAPPSYTIRTPTPEEIREQQRKAEESIKVLEANTPELYEGRPGQVRGQ